ncbi:DUF3575 domain-containing protein [uncultured Muriicola sp.]|uniref:DUF3575 domain-containing protein n=1 Tax=uncultured Muriicola sp. TaxID=1583102 RepID=UPI0026220D13|nr:DUF3575 domain-containing protein [uncultured Muriicola sp.]
MKRFFSLCILLFLCGNTLLSQEVQQDETDRDETDRDELKINVFNLITFKYLDGAYERIIDEESSFGFGVLINAGNDEDLFEYNRQYSITPYYRRYFSKSFASGFFVEGFGMLNSGEQDIYTFDDITLESERTGENYTDFALGISVGGKFISKKGFIAEVYGGIGRNFFSTDFSPEVVPRGGVSLGFRF